jgi:hypothetical protein
MYATGEDPGSSPQPPERDAIDQFGDDELPYTMRGRTSSVRSRNVSWLSGAQRR